MAIPTLVPQAPASVDQETHSTASTEDQCPLALQEGQTSSSWGEAQTDGLSFVRRSLANKGFSAAVQATICNSWRSNIQKQYNTYLAKWELFTGKRGVDPLSPPVGIVLDLLQELYDSGLGYSCINTARSALSTFLILENNVTIGAHPLVQRFIRGVFQARPALPRYTSMWDTSIVLRYLQTLHPLTDLSLKNLTYKLIMMCALVTGQRCQTIHLMSLKNMHMDEDKSYLFYIDQLVKQSAPGREQPVLTIPRFTLDEKLCVASTLEEYLSRTQDLRDGENQLFISVVRPYKKVSKETISRWIKEVMTLSGVDTTMFTPHSTRAASTSKVFNKVPLQTIMKSASWRSDCVFNKFYNKPIARSSENSFGHALLSAV